MIGIFKNKHPVNIITLFVFGLVIKLPMFLHPHVPAETGYEGVLYAPVLKFLANKADSFPAIFPIITFFLLFVQAFTLNQFLNNQRMMTRASFFPGMAYMLVTSLFAEWNYFSAPLIVNTILLIVLSALFWIYNQENAKGAIYNIGLSLGIAVFLFFPSVTFLLWIFFALMLMRPFRLNEWVLILVGVITPFYFYGVYLFITDQLTVQNLVPKIAINLPSVKQSAWLAGSVFLLIIPFLAGSYFVQDNLRRMLIQVRKGWSLILLYLLGAILVPFVNSSSNFENWVLAVMPFAAFHSCTYFYSKKRVFPVILFWATVAYIVAYQYNGPGW